MTLRTATGLIADHMRACEAAGKASWLTNSYGLDVSPYVAIKTLTE